MRPIEIASQLEIATELLQHCRYKELIDHLDQLGWLQMAPEERAQYALLWSEARLFTGCYDFGNVLGEALEFYKKSNENSKYGAAKYLYGRLLLASGDLLGAKEALLEAYIYAKRCDNYSGEVRALNHLSFISYHVGDFEAAVVYLRKCIDVYTRVGDNGQKDVIIMNLSQLYFALGRILDSLASYKTLATSTIASKSKNAASLYLAWPIPHALKGDFKTAKATIAKALPYLDSYIREQAIYFENLGWIHLLAEDYKRAEKALLDGLKISMEIAPESALVSQIKRRLADACLGQKRYADARRYADEALVVAEKINERVEIAACWRVFGRLDASGAAPKARDWFKKAIDMFAMIGSRYELAATRYLAAASGLYHNGERQALLYLARAYFAGEDVVFMLEKIDREIKRTPAAATPRISPANGEQPAIVAQSPVMIRLVDLARHVAQSEMSVLLTGPTGSGKDLLARYIHYHSCRPGKFIAVNVAAIPDTMVESELFGHRRGAFTGADHDKTGLIEEAHNGTLYLNEIADASPILQAKLLDVLENRTLRRLGETAQRKAAFRLIAATNHDLEKAVRDGSFRADLYHRLREVPIHLPPLCDRPGDIPSLLAHFLKASGIDVNGNGAQFTRLSEALAERDWPGNVRQFESEVKRLSLMARGDLAQMIELAPNSINLPDRDQLVILLRECEWNRTEVAKRLKVSEGTVRLRIKKYSISTPDNS